MTRAAQYRGDERRSDPPQLVVLGRIAGLFGVQGWLRVFSHTAPREKILGYSPWYLRRGETWEPYEPKAGRRQGKGVVVSLVGIADRDAAATLLGADVAVPRDAFSAPPAGEYYWTDLEGLEVVTLDGRVLGVIDHLFETGSNDVMVVRGERERLVPFVEPQVVREVDFAGRRVVVDWAADF